MPFMLRRLCIIVYILLLAFGANAQSYPVHISTQLVAPFSGYVADYASAGEEKLKLLFVFTDFTKPSYNIKLKISIQGQGITIQSKPFFFDGPHTLQPGIPFELSGSDLFNLLNTQNLDFTGITKAQYEQKKVLPEGFYSVCVTAYDYNNPTPIQVSNVGCAQAWMVLSDPPFLNLPQCASTVTITNPQQQTFTFTQMNMGSPNSAANTEYVFELWEIRPQGAVANNVVQTTPPIYTYTTNVTMINYGITEPPLLPGMEYAWRVKAQDITGRDFFKNGGYSQVCTFTYGGVYDDLHLDLNIHAQAVTQRQIKVWWDSVANFTSYQMEFRKAGTTNWFPVITSNARTRVLDLEPQTTYEFHVRGSENDYTSPFSDPVSATTLAPPDYQCGELPASLNSANFVPLKQAIVGMHWQVGQFEMEVTGLSNPVSPTGTYSGYGRIRIPFVSLVNCGFNNISVSEEQVVVQGKVNALSHGLDDWVQNNSIGTIHDGTEEPEIKTHSPLSTSDIQVNSTTGTFTVEGNTYTYTPNGATIEDSNGNLFIVTADGQVINAGTAGSGHGEVPDKKNYIVTDRGVTTFNGSLKQLYGIDKFKYPSLINYYLTVRNLTADSKDPVDWKSVMAQKYDMIDLSYQLQGGLTPDSILFITGTGTVYKTQGTGSVRQLYVIGGKHGDVQELFACYKHKDTLVNIAKINIVSYKQEQKKVTLVPLGNVSLDKATIQKNLNDIYKQSVASWEVDIAPAITVADTLWDKDGNGRLNTGSNLFDRYSKELIAINKYVRAQTYYKSDQYYLIVTDKQTDSLMPGILGEMPRGRNIGYLFTANPIGNIIAHELGHGAFALEHSFDGNASMPRATSNCLMDYANGIELYKGKYWDYVHEPVSIIGALEGDDEGAIVTSDELKWISRMLNKIKTAVLENKPLVLLKNECGKAWNTTNIFVGGYCYRSLTIGMPFCPGSYVDCNPKGKIKKVTRTYWDATSQSNKALDYISVDNCIEIGAPPQLLDALIEFLDTKTLGRNLLIFSNGYRPNPPWIGDEHPKENDVANFTDIWGYWGGVDAVFVDRIGTKNVVYADGHHTVGTSNHISEASFTSNYSMWFCFAGKKPVAPLFPVTLLPDKVCEQFLHNTSLYRLHTTPNDKGFNTRKYCGKACGYDIISKIMNGTIKFDPKIDTIDIVSHSMGHAYALGIIEALKSSPLKIKFGRFYSLAPENACSSNGAIDFSIFEEVWQYGCNELNPKWEQDGVAPQCEIPGITTKNPKKYGRIHFPKQFDPKDYLESHSIVNYFWIFSEIKYNPTDPKGYVRKRH